MLLKDKGGDFVAMPPGSQPARCYLVVDLGKQRTQFGDRHEIVLGFESTTERLPDGRLLTCTQRYTASLSDKAKLREHLEGWRGRAFTKDELQGWDIRKVLGASCELNIVHNDRGYADVRGIAKARHDYGRLENEPVCFMIDEWNQAMFDRLVPEWMRKAINARIVEEKKAEPVAAPPADEPEDFDDFDKLPDEPENPAISL